MSILPIEQAIARFKKWFLKLPIDWQQDILRFVYENRPKKDVKLSRILGYENTGSAFDIDLAEGQVSEDALAEILKGEMLEVKTDYMVSKTGNIAVEYYCRGNPSGISTSKSSYWAFVLEGPKYQKEVIVIIKKDRLVNLLAGSRSVKGGDNGVANMYLLPVSKLIE